MTSDSTTFEPLTGNCTCKAITYTVHNSPLVVHCCHCTWCQRESGTAFAINVVVESSYFNVTSDTKPEIIKIPSPSGEGQRIGRCPNCRIALFSHYGGMNDALTYFKAGTLSDDSRVKIRPDVHIFTSTKVEWINLEKEAERGIPIFEEYYNRNKEVWKKENNERLDNLKKKIAAEKVQSSGKGEDVA